MKTLIFTVLFLVIAINVAVSYARGHHLNGYRKQKRRVRTIIKSENDPGIYGDGAWLSKQPSRSAKLRHREPMGM